MFKLINLGCLAVLGSVFVFCPSAAFARDHAKDYMVGIIMGTKTVSGGNIQTCTSGQCLSTPVNTYSVYFKVDNGEYRSGPPVAGGILTEPYIKPFFAANLRQGDKILFAASCDKHGSCNFWFPDPDNKGKEIHTIGQFQSRTPESNTQSLCGTGKLRPEIEAQVCPRN